jgi:regulator of replication initiation timing
LPPIQKEISSLQEEYRVKISEKDFQQAFKDAVEKNNGLLTENDRLRRKCDEDEKLILTLRMTIERKDAEKAKEMEDLAMQLVGQVGGYNDKGQNALEAFKLEVATELKQLDREIKRLQ